MAKREKDKSLDKKLWEGIYESDFLNTKNIEEVDVSEFDEEKMALFAVNVTMWRHFMHLSDSLKPVERRILYVLYLQKAYPGKKLKSSLINGFTAVYHAHGDAYPSLVGMVQDWKKQIPLISGKGNFASVSHDLYAADRYTEANMSKYAQECFFEDYDPDCVETVFNSASGLDEPIYLPSKFPNALVNGGNGFIIGNSFRIPTYNIVDIIDVCKRVIQAPETANVFMIPDLPTGCQIIDDGHSFQDIVNEGHGTLKMRADAEIIDSGKTWTIKITSVPWMVSLPTIKKRIVELGKNGVFVFKDIGDYSYAVKTANGVQSKIDFRLIFDKAHDPYVILNKLYSLTELQKNVACDFKMIMDDLTIKRLNMRQLITSWIDERRSYKRRLFNKRLTKISSRIDILEILLELCQGSNLDKAIKIVRTSHDEEAIERLQHLAKMSSHQATEIYNIGFRAFNADAPKRYSAELTKLKAERKELMKTIRSEKRIDEIIIDELEDLRKYAIPRRSKIVAEDTGKHVSDTMHSIVITAQGLIKKLAYYKDKPSRNVNMGSFKSGDYPVEQMVVHNSATVTFLDSFGRYSIIPVYEIDNTELSQFGHSLYNITKLTGKVVQCMETYDADLVKRVTKKIGTPYLVTITQRGYAKKTPMTVFLGMKNEKNIRAMKIRDDDSLAVADVMFDKSNVVIYTQKGDYSYMSVKDIGEQSKDSMGLITVRVRDDDRVCGYAPVGSDDDFVVVISEKGMVKKVGKQYFGDVGRRGIKADQGSIMTLDPTDGIRFASGMKKGQKVTIAMRNLVVTLDEEKIPDMTKKARGKKLISPTATANIVAVQVHD